MAIQRSNPAAVNLGTAVNSLASSATAAAQSNEVISSTTNNVTDITVNVGVVCGAHTQSASTLVTVFVWGTNDDNSYPGATGTVEVVTGTAGSITLGSFGNIALKWLQSVSAVPSQTNKLEGSVVGALGFVPRKWGIVIQNQTGAALAASGHYAEYVETFYN
jgi:hypothetical protein